MITGRNRLLLGLFACLQLAAAGASAAEDCEREPNMAAIRACAEQQQTTELDAIYQDTLAYVRRRDPKAAKLLAEAQAAWRVFAEKSCEFTVASRQPDSNELRLGCWQAFIEARERVLKNYRRDFGKVPRDLMHP